MPSIKDVEEQIFRKEGFRVRFTPLDPKTKQFPAYEYGYMCSNKWKISDWRMQRLGAYLTLARGIEILDQNGAPLRRDPKIGNLRDAYAEANEPSAVENEPARDNVVAIGSAKKTNRAKRR